jgi:hypothetical protein
MSGLVLVSSTSAATTVSARVVAYRAIANPLAVAVIHVQTRARIALPVSSELVYAYPTSFSMSVRRNGAYSIVTVGKSATCTVSVVGGSGVVPLGATHALSVPTIERSLWSVSATGGDASPLTQADGQSALAYTITPLVVPTVGTTAVLTIGFGGVVVSYTLSGVFTHSTVYAFPTSLVS